VLILSMTVSSFVALALAIVNHVLKLGLLSKLSERVTFVLIPPLVLIFLVLGTIFLGLATPTEGGAMGALGAFVMALARRKLELRLLKEALENTTKLAIFVLFILIGSTVFSFTFNAADGHIFIEHLFSKLPGGAMGFLIVVNLLVFVLGMFIDFFEIAFIVVPLLVPVAEKLLPALLPAGSDALIWFGVIIAMNLQTSFLTPPFGFALFYLRSVAAKSDYNDRITGERWNVASFCKTPAWPASWLPAPHRRPCVHAPAIRWRLASSFPKALDTIFGASRNLRQGTSPRPPAASS
jgi:tripartite ATP-independent transporter DctM subunit